MSNSLLHEVASWKLEAKLEDNNRYFFHINIVDKIISGSKSYVIGRKGTGKTAITEHITKEVSYSRFAKKLSFKNFPFQDLYNLKNDSYTTPNQYITLWKYLIYSSVAKLMIKNEGIDSSVREQLARIYADDIEQSLARSIKRWVSGGFKISILGSGVEANGSSSAQKNETSWVERVEALEDILLKYLDDSEYLIVFDELDEDYRDVMDPSNYKRYTDLLTSLFKAVQDVRSVFSEGRKLFPVVFLRDDIYEVLMDPDRNKWNDLKVALEWDEVSIKDLLAFRLSKANSPTDTPYSFGYAWRMMFLNSPVKYGHKQQKEMNTFDYITRSTQLRPRDYIRYLQACAEEALRLGQMEITPEVVTKIDKAFSNYLRNEIEDEINGIIPDIKSVLNIFSIVRKQTLSIAEFEVAYEEAVQSGDVQARSTDFLLRILFNFSVIGNQPTQKNKHVFRYLTPEANFNRKEPIVLHRGLFKALQII
ncbi:P-loop ATPase, Sll1717 family [Pseudomonas sp. IT-P291]|uniref:P-loop ATPase, Sll1717 family n=1 Tax=Pseudomonas sp. IT-P291 TaxID=3026448 RepID=UPI0039DF8BEF